jgi:hypothetical protein
MNLLIPEKHWLLQQIILTKYYFEVLTQIKFMSRSIGISHCFTRNLLL